jgi:hypothetical protein
MGLGNPGPAPPSRVVDARTLPVEPRETGGVRPTEGGGADPQEEAVSRSKPEATALTW